MMGNFMLSWDKDIIMVPTILINLDTKEKV